MSSKENHNPSLLSKVAKFVRNPTTNWTDLDKQDPEPDAGYSKQALKEMIERKRQNDFVRKREFDQLRKLRSRDPAVSPDMAGRPSYFQSSLPSNPDERAMTIKKIDEIEAQMSNQWWQGKNDGSHKSSAAERKPAGKPDTADVVDDEAYAPTRLSPMHHGEALSGSETSDFPPTQDNSGFGPNPTRTPGPDAPAAAGPRVGDGHGFSVSRAPTIEMVDGATDAAVRGDVRETMFRRIGLAAAKYWICKQATAHAAEAMECFGGNGYAEESGMPRLYREAPLMGIWEGSGNVSALDTLRAMATRPDCVEVLFDELSGPAGQDPRLAAHVAALRAQLADPATLEYRARRIAEDIALGMQGALLVAHGHPAVTEAFLATRLAGDRGGAYGTLPAGLDLAPILERAMVKGG